MMISNDSNNIACVLASLIVIAASQTTEGDAEPSARDSFQSLPPLLDEATT
jgi:hypothetical protein